MTDWKALICAVVGFLAFPAVVVVARLGHAEELLFLFVCCLMGAFGWSLGKTWK